MADRHDCPTDPGPDVLMADSMSVVRCEHGTIYWRLHNSDGAVFAAGGMADETALKLIEAACVQIERAVAVRTRPATVQ